MSDPAERSDRLKDRCRHFNRATPAIRCRLPAKRAQRCAVGGHEQRVRIAASPSRGPLCRSLERNGCYRSQSRFGCHQTGSIPSHARTWVQGHPQSQMPKINAVGHSSNSGVAFVELTLLSALPFPDFRKLTPFSSLSRRMASASRWGTCRLVICPTPSMSRPAAEL